MATEALRRGDLVQTRRPSAGLWRDAFGRLRKNRPAMIGLVMVIVLFIIAVIGPFIADNSDDAARRAPESNHRADRLSAPEEGSLGRFIDDDHRRPPLRSQPRDQPGFARGRC